MRGGGYTTLTCRYFKNNKIQLNPLNLFDVKIDRSLVVSIALFESNPVHYCAGRWIHYTYMPVLNKIQYEAIRRGGKTLLELAFC
jgi:hypothetical protein